jgi:3-methyladenine DNA glycosylase AlkD
VNARYALLAGDYGSLLVGWMFFKGFAPTIVRAKDLLHPRAYHEWWQVVDLETGTVVDASDWDELKTYYPAMCGLAPAAPESST